MTIVIEPVDQETDTELEAISQRIADLYQEGDRKRFLIGALLSRADRRYGTGTVNAISTNTGISRSALYDYLRVERYYRGRRLSAARTIRDYPNLFFSHLRAAMRFKNIQDAMLALDNASDLGMSADRFRVYVAEQLGKPVPPEAIFDETGGWMDLLSALALTMGRYLPSLRVRIIVRPE